MITTAEVCDFAPGEGSADGAGEWVPVDVPGDVHTALVAAGRIEHPFYDRNEDECAWMEEREWWYRASFDDPGPAPGERLRLVFHGLDTYATVFLNGEELGRHANMFREASVDVTDLVRAENTLAVRFDPPLQHAGPRDPEQWSSTPAERVWMRKAQYGFGWDLRLRPSRPSPRPHPRRGPRTPRPCLAAPRPTGSAPRRPARHTHRSPTGASRALAAVQA